MKIKLFKVTCTKAYRISEQGTYFSLTPWGSNTQYYEGYDDGGKEYILPSGYKVAKSNQGTIEIYSNSHGQYCDFTIQNGLPVLIDDIDNHIIPLCKEG